MPTERDEITSSKHHMLRRSVLERLLRARLVYARAAMARALSFEYLNRQLVWHELSELLLFLLPLVNVGRLKAAVMARLPRLSTALAPPGPALGTCPAALTFTLRVG